jgi:hypothetical protein
MPTCSSRSSGTGTQRRRPQQRRVHLRQGREARIRQMARSRPIQANGRGNALEPIESTSSGPKQICRMAGLARIIGSSRRGAVATPATPAAATLPPVDPTTAVAMPEKSWAPPTPHPRRRRLPSPPPFPSPPPSPPTPSPSISPLCLCQCAHLVLCSALSSVAWRAERRSGVCGRVGERKGWGAGG